MSALSANIAAAQLPGNTSNFTNSLQHELCSLSLSQQRAVCAILGAAVADAATRPFHWVYNRVRLEEVVQPANAAIEFWPESISPYYTLPTGRRSCYNDLGLAMLQALPSPAEGVVFKEESFLQSLLTMFATDSEYAEAMQRRKEGYDPVKRTEDRAPIDGPWQQAAVTSLLEDLQAGRRPSGNPKLLETDGLCSTIPLIARLAANHNIVEEMLKTVHSAASILSSNSISLVHTLSAALLLFELIRGNELSAEVFLSTIKHAQSLDQSWILNSVDKLDFSKVYHELLEVENSQDGDYVDMVEIFGKPCANPGSFMGAILACLQAESTAQAFVHGIRNVIRGGGCNCSRANLAGALLGAHCGIYLDGDHEEGFSNETEVSNRHNQKGIPLSWLLRTDHIEDILTLAIQAVK